MDEGKNMYKDIRERLISISEPNIKALSCKLSPNVNPNLVYGIRVPKLRDFAKKMVKEDLNVYN